MRQLTIKELAAYLPYGVKIQWIDEAYTLVGFNKNTIYHDKGFFVELPYKLKMFLRPLSDLTKEIEHNGEKFVPMIKLADDFYKPRKHNMFGNIAECRNGQLWFESTSKRFLYSEGDNTECPLRIFEMYQKLFEWHFDVFGLINDNLAIDLNKI